MAYSPTHLYVVLHVYTRDGELEVAEVLGIFNSEDRAMTYVSQREDFEHARRSSIVNNALDLSSNVTWSWDYDGYIETVTILKTSISYVESPSS